MTGLEFATLILFLATHVAVFVLGLIIGGVVVATHIAHKLREAQDEVMRKLSTSLPPLSGDEWMQQHRQEQQKKDEEWLKRHLGDTDKGKEKK